MQRAKSSEAQQRLALLQQIAEKRQQRLQQVVEEQPPTAKEENLDLEDLEDSSPERENRPPSDSSSDSEEEQHQPAAVKGRLKRMDMAQNAAPAGTKTTALEELMANVGKLNIGHSQHASASGRGCTMPMPRGADALRLAAQQALPDDDEDEEDDSVEEVDSSSGDDGHVHEEDGEKVDSPPASTSQAPARWASLEISSAAGKKLQPHPGALVLGDKEEFVLPATLHKKLYPHQVCIRL